MLVALDNGEHCGSLSGGCVEDDFLERVAAGYFSPINQVVRYGDGGLAPTMALPCGGVLDVLVEYLAPGDATRQHLAQIEQAFAGGELVARQVIPGTTQRSIRAGHMGDARVAVSDQEISIRIGAVQRLILAGLSPVSEFCAGFALSLGYEVILC